MARHMTHLINGQAEVYEVNAYAARTYSLHSSNEHTLYGPLWGGNVQRYDKYFEVKTCCSIAATGSAQFNIDAKPTSL